MTLATAGCDGLPDARIVLLKSYDERGLVFFTNERSAKGMQLAENAQAAVVLHWESLCRQVRARGAVQPIDPVESDAYFARRPRGSRLGAVASRQSEPLSDRETLLLEVDAATTRFEGRPVLRPSHWRGFRLVPVAFEFWRGGGYRLHDRIRFTRCDAGWTSGRLYP
ncbi:pyridoxamine 5'-phosphate oxidase [Methylorubrum sp. B1-46]|uniref:pyridoxamine 5'-phosphate oxidase n=1 Tax=Methylorubrum sp. B1-46 TaxID=2897334 RepID=UPI000A7BB542